MVVSAVFFPFFVCVPVALVWMATQDVTDSAPSECKSDDTKFKQWVDLQIGDPNKDPFDVMVLSSLVASFEYHYRWFRAWLLLERGLLALLMLTLVNNPEMQLITCAVYMMITLAVSLWTRLFVSDAEDKLDLFWRAANIAVIMLGLLRHY